MVPLRHRHRNPSRVPLLSPQNYINSAFCNFHYSSTTTSFDQALDLLVPVRYMHYCTSTPGLSPCRLQGVLLPFGMGYLILRWVSRLDAFSVYPFRTSLPGYAPGGTTGSPEVRPSRSSRTRDRSFQISCAHDR